MSQPAQPTPRVQHLRPTFGRSPLPETLEIASSRDLIATKQRVTEQDRLFVRFYIEGGLKDEEAAARSAGFKRRGIGHALVRRLAQVIEYEREHLLAVGQMDADEGLRLVAELGRRADDERVRLGALRTVLEVQGLLTKGAGTWDAKEARKVLESLMNAIRTKMLGAKGSNGSRIRIRQATQTATQVDIEPADGPSDDAKNPVDKGRNTSLGLLKS